MDENQKPPIFYLQSFYVVTIFIFILLFLALTNVKSIAYQLGFAEDIIGLDTTFSAFSALYIDDILNRPFLAVMSNSVFWGVVGTISYLVLSLGIRLFTDFSNNFMFIHDFIHPKEFSMKRYVAFVAKGLVVRGVVFFIGITSLYILLRYSLVLAIKGFNVFLFNLTVIEGWVSLLIALVVMFVHIYVTIVVFRILKRPFLL